MATPSSSDARSVPCRECGAPNSQGAVRCWMCGSGLPARDDAQQAAGNPYASPLSMATFVGRADLQRGIWTWQSIAVLGLIVFVLGGLTLALPGLGIVLSVIALPAAVRARAVSRRSTVPLEKQSIWTHLVNFNASLGLVIGVGLASLVAFVMTCTGIFFATATVGEVAGTNEMTWVGMALGVIGGLVAVMFCAIVLLQKSWPK